MQKNSPNFPRLPRVAQITTSHCGPAVLEMLIRFLGFNVTQEEIVDSINVASKLDTHGVTVAELGEATRILFPNLQFWFKEHSNTADLNNIINKYKYPVAIEWQGIFLEYSDDDNGHYSIVTHIDLDKNSLLIFDPYPPFAKSDRKFQITQVEPRWWEINEVLDLETNQFKDIRDDHMMFIVTPKDELFPVELGMMKG